jgi:4'-phosphopantetheinyl transferase
MVQVNSGIGEPVVIFPSIELIATAGWSVPIGMEDRTIHVWGFSLDGSPSFVEHCRSWLSEDERGRAARFIRQQDQLQYVLAHGSCRAVLARYTGLDPSSVTFQMGATGKPALAEMNNGRHRIRFNLSHSHGRVLIAVAHGQDVGADLEQIRDKVEAVKLAERFYAPSEHGRVAGVAGLDQAKRFYRYWVAKEAVLKGQAVGLLSLQQCEILDSSDAPRAEVHLLEGATMQPGWTVHWLECGPEWIGAVSAYGSDWTIRAMTRG